MNAKAYVEIAILIIAILTFVLYVTWQIKKKGLRQVAVTLIVYAEDNIKHNEDKFNYCVDQLIKLIPAPFNLFITVGMVENIVQSTFDLVKKALDYREEK